MNLEWSVVWEYRYQFLEGAWLTVVLTVATMAIALPGGLFLAFLRLSPYRVVNVPATAFVEFFRATPLILQIFWVFYVMPMAFDIQLSAFSTGLLGLVLNVSAFNSETFRAGILSIRKGQWHAGLTLGMSRVQEIGRAHV